MITIDQAPPRYYVRAANGATIDLVDSQQQAAKIAKDNKAQIWIARGGKLVRIA